MASSPNIAALAPGFLQALRAGRLAHAYIVATPDRAVGIACCESLLQHLFCERDAASPCGECRGCLGVRRHAHPDLVWIEPESKARHITINRIRETILPLMQQTEFFAGGWRAAVLVDADGLTPEAANAFLKILEEPPPRSLMLLQTSDPAELMATVRSRCQLLRVSSRTAGGDSWRQRTLELLAELTVGPDPLSAIVAANRFAALLVEARQTAEKELEAGEASEGMQEEQPPADAGLEKEVREARIRARMNRLREDILRTIELWYRDVWACTLGLPSSALIFPAQEAALRATAARHSPASALAALREVAALQRRLDRNLSTESALEAFFRAVAVL